MKKLLALAGLLALAIGLVTEANAGTRTKDYNGTFEPGGTLSFTVKPTDNGKKVVKFKFFLFPVQCDSGMNTTTGRITFGMKVRNKEFHARAVNDAGTSELAVEGRLKGGGEAQGTLKVKGSGVNVDHPPPRRGTDSCSSPKTDWTASTVN